MKCKKCGFFFACPECSKRFDKIDRDVKREEGQTKPYGTGLVETLRASALGLERAGYLPISRVHDETIVYVPEAADIFEELERINDQEIKREEVKRNGRT